MFGSESPYTATYVRATYTECIKEHEFLQEGKLGNL